jgi:four helix bundle protein
VHRQAEESESVLSLRTDPTGRTLYCSNIAEGTGREGIRESRQFFNIAKGSVYEVVSIAHVLRQENLLTAEEYGDCYRLCDRVAGMLSGLIAKRQPK